VRCSLPRSSHVDRHGDSRTRGESPRQSGLPRPPPARDTGLPGSGPAHPSEGGHADPTDALQIELLRWLQARGGAHQLRARCLGAPACPTSTGFCGCVGSPSRQRGSRSSSPARPIPPRHRRSSRPSDSAMCARARSRRTLPRRTAAPPRTELSFQRTSRWLHCSSRTLVQTRRHQRVGSAPPPRGRLGMQALGRAGPPHAGGRARAPGDRARAAAARPRRVPGAEPGCWAPAGLGGMALGREVACRRFRAHRQRSMRPGE
jgi:hypothetical protein